MSEQFNDLLKNAMKASNKQEVGVLRMIKSRFQQKLTEKGFTGEMTDEVVLKVIGTYVKQMEKSIPDYKKAGDSAAGKLEEIRYEIDYLSKFLPKMMGEEETRKLVRGIIEELGLDSPSQTGRIMGALMKDYKGKIDAGLAKKIVTEELSGE